MHELRLEHGKPLLWGPPNDRRALVLEGVKPKVVRAADVPEDRVWVHDETDRATALVLAQLWAPDYPVPVGVLSSQAETTYEEILVQQEEQAPRARPAPHDRIDLRLHRGAL